MSDQKYFVNSNLFGTDIYYKIYSDKVFKTLDVIRELGLPQLSTDPLWLDSDLTGEVELSRNLYVTTATAKGEAFKAAKLDVYRTFTIGDFTFDKSGETRGSVTGVVNVRSDGSFTGKYFNNPIPLEVYVRKYFDLLIEQEEGTLVTSLAPFQKFLPNGWQQDPFSKNLISATDSFNLQTSNANIEEVSDKSATLTTTSSVDTLTGIKKKKDIFKFDADPRGQVDKVIGFNAKEKDILSISKSAFGIERGTFAIAKNAKILAKQLGTNVDIVYYRKTGELILNANGAEPGYGEDGGVFAVLMGKPTIGSGSVQFY